MNDNIKTYRIKVWELAVLFLLAFAFVALLVFGLFAGGAQL